MTVVSVRKSYPIYILLDVSESMRLGDETGRTPQDAFTSLIPDLIFNLSDAPALATTVWMSVIAFSDGAELLSPMTSLAGPVNVRAPRDGRETDYALALEFLEERCKVDVLTMQEHGRNAKMRTTVADPLVFVITDGAPFRNAQFQPPDEWQPHRNRLVGTPTNAKIAAIGLVGAHPRTLYELSTGKAGGERNAFIARPDAPADGLARSVINVIERSIKLSVRAGDMIIDEPAGMRRVHG